MRCPTCDGRGMTWGRPPLALELAPVPPGLVPVPSVTPCPDCGGCEFAHCCEGDRAEPCPVPEPDAPDDEPPM